MYSSIVHKKNYFWKGINMKDLDYKIFRNVMTVAMILMFIGQSFEMPQIIKNILVIVAIGSGVILAYLRPKRKKKGRKRRGK